MQEYYNLLCLKHGCIERKKICAYDVSDAINQARSLRFRGNSIIIGVETPKGRRIAI